MTERKPSEYGQPEDRPRDRSGWFKSSGTAGDCLAADELWLFGRGELTADRRDAVRDHLTVCVWCSEKVARLTDPVLSPSDSTADPVPPGLNRQTRRLWTPSPVLRIWRSQALWAIFFVASIGISFGVPRYHKQFLVIALVCGIRWALSGRANRQSISIAKIDAGDASGRSSRQRDFKNHRTP